MSLMTPPSQGLYSLSIRLLHSHGNSCAYLFFNLRSLIKKDIHNVDFHHPSRLLTRLERKAEEIVSKQIPVSDARILESLLDNLGEDYTQEKFFEATPGFYRSKSAEDLEKIKENLSSESFTKFRRSVSRFLDETRHPIR